jgi:hypothetical protein
VLVVSLTIRFVSIAAMKIEEIDSPALNSLRGYLEAVSDFIRTGEIKWYFEARLFGWDGGASDIARLIKLAYPTSTPDAAEIREGSIADIIETFQHELGKFMPANEGKRVLAPILSGTAEMWKYLAECVDVQHARIFEYYNAEGDGLRHGILGGFTIILHDETLGRCLILVGSTSD